MLKSIFVFILNNNNAKINNVNNNKQKYTREFPDCTLVVVLQNEANCVSYINLVISPRIEKFERD